MTISSIFVQHQWAHMSASAASVGGTSWPIHAHWQKYLATIMGPFKDISSISLE